MNLDEIIRNKITENNNFIGFDEFMSMALYHPGKGYYSNGSKKFGRDGDFITAPETSDLFGLKDIDSISQHVEEVQSLDVLINNASIFYPTPLDNINTQAVLDLMQVNCFAPYFLSIALKDKLTQKKGQIINLVDIYSHKPIKDYSAYSMSKSALAMLTKSLALDLAPHVRVCGVSPGAILWPSQSTEKEHTKILDKVPLKAKGDPKNITESVIFLINSSYITGEILTVDGGRLIA
jgi:pteridine reductase